MRLDELGIEMVLDELEIEISQEFAPRDICTAPFALEISVLL